MSEKLVQDAAESQGVYMAVQRSKNRSKQSPRTLPITKWRTTKNPEGTSRTICHYEGYSL